MPIPQNGEDGTDLVKDQVELIQTNRHGNVNNYPTRRTKS
jgi:hypothetical protein